MSKKAPVTNAPVAKKTAVKKAVAAAIAEQKGPSTADIAAKAPKAPKIKRATKEELNHLFGKESAEQLPNDNRLTPAEMPEPVPSMTKQPKAETPTGTRNYARGPKQHRSEYGEGVCAMVHDLYFAALKKAGSVDAVVRADVIKQAVEEGADIHTAKTQFQRARSWAMLGNIEPKPRRTKKAEENAA